MSENLENKSLKNGYIGESKRDASSTIRGYVYQNLIAIEELIKPETARVFCEYVEDVTSVDNDGNCKIIQAKYYSSSLSSNMQKEVYRELYCQYLKMLEDGKLKTIIPILDVYSSQKKEITAPTKLEGEEWIQKHKKIAVIKELSDLETKKLDKDERESAIINRFGTPEKLENYHKAYVVKHRKDDLDKFREKLQKSLLDLFENEIEDTALDGVDKAGEVLLGLAYLMILKTFDRIPSYDNATDMILKHKEIKRADFISFMFDEINATDEKIISRVVSSMVTEIYFSVLCSNSKMTDAQNFVLENIVENTKKWMEELLETVEGQYALINTISLRNSNTLKSFQNKKLKSRERIILQSYREIKSFMKYLWKIMMNLCLHKTNFDLDNDKEMLDPRSYIVKENKEYICFRFTKDFVKSSVILASVNSDEGKEQRRNVYSRMFDLKPEKWFMGGDHKKAGRYEYSYSPADISDIEQTVTTVANDSDIFYLECMKCIGIDVDDWVKNEDCKLCIFSQDCQGGSY